MEIQINGVPTQATNIEITFTSNRAKPYGDLPIRLESCEVTCTGMAYFSPAFAEEIRVGLWRRHREQVICLCLLYRQWCASLN